MILTSVPYKCLTFYNFKSLSFQPMHEYDVSGNPKLTRDNSLNKDELFMGDENPIVYSRFYSMTLNCDFILNNYPFDFQQCYIDVS